MRRGWNKGFVTNVVHEYDTLPMWTGKRAEFNLAANIGIYGAIRPRTTMRPCRS